MHVPFIMHKGLIFLDKSKVLISLNDIVACRELCRKIVVSLS